MKNLTLAAGGQIRLSAPPRPPRQARLQVMAQVFESAGGAIEAVYLVELFVQGQMPRPARVLACLFQPGLNMQQAEAALERLGVALGNALQMAAEMDLLPVLPGDQLVQPIREMGILIYRRPGETAGVAAEPAQKDATEPTATAPPRPWWRFW